MDGSNRLARLFLANGNQWQCWGISLAKDDRATKATDIGKRFAGAGNSSSSNG